MRKALFGLGLVGSMAFARPLENHPHIRSAIGELQEARKDLQNAAHDFGGHRVDALKAVDAALVQLRIAQHYDK